MALKNDWKSKTRQERWASILYSSHATEETRQEMARLAEQGKKPPSGPNLLPNDVRGATSPLGGVAAWKGSK